MRGTIEELARREKVNRGYMSRVLGLTLLAPDIVEAILDGRQPEGMRLEDLPEGFPLEWERARVLGRLAAKNILGSCCGFRSGREERNVGLLGYRAGYAR